MGSFREGRENRKVQTLYHLQRNHGKEYQAKIVSDDESKRKIDEFVLKTTCSSTCARKITQLLVDMVAMDARPTATVEGAGFKRLLNYLEPGYKVPSAVHIALCLHERYSQVKDVVLEHLQAATISRNPHTLCGHPGVLLEYIFNNVKQARKYNRYT